jgi:NitT/TauT family transport system substrate-binding protein
MRTLVALLAVVAGLISTPLSAQTKLTLGYSPAHAFMPAFVAKDQGFFARHGLDVTLQMLPLGPMVPNAIASGGVQIGTLTPPVILLASEGGLELQMVAGAVNQSRANPAAAVFARQGSNIKTAGDFRGKKVATPALNAVLHVTFMKWLRNNGVDYKQVNFVEVPFPQLGDAMKSGLIDAALVVEPFMTAIQRSQAGYLVSRYVADIAESYLEAFYSTTRQYAQANPKALADFRDALREAVAWISKNPDAARKTLVTYLKLPEPVAMSMPMSDYVVDMKQADMEFWVELCKEFGITRGTVTAAQVIAR